MDIEVKTHQIPRCWHAHAHTHVRGSRYPEGTVSTVVEVSRMPPSDEVLIEVEATYVLGA